MGSTVGLVHHGEKTAMPKGFGSAPGLVQCVQGGSWARYSTMEGLMKIAKARLGLVLSLAGMLGALGVGCAIYPIDDPGDSEVRAGQEIDHAPDPIRIG